MTHKLLVLLMVIKPLIVYFYINLIRFNYKDASLQSPFQTFHASEQVVKLKIQFIDQHFNHY